MDRLAPNARGRLDARAGVPAPSSLEPGRPGGQGFGGNGSSVSIRGATKQYGALYAIRDVSLEVTPGEFLTILGPSGSGKTTILSAIGGFSWLSAGEIFIGERAVTRLPPERRNVGIVFQHYALFPHMTVAENVGFPLQMRGVKRAAGREKIDRVLALVQMSQYRDRFPSQLSGGQQQRVALARAMAFDPPVLLLDEPLSALDKMLRDAVQLELKALHAKTGVTMIYVTHDQTEALILSDRIAVMHNGRIEQLGEPRDLYDRPKTPFVADFIGESNVLRGRIARVEGAECEVVTEGKLACRIKATPELTKGQWVRIVVRPERVALEPPARDNLNRYQGRIEVALFLGQSVKYRVSLSPVEAFTVTLPNHQQAAPVLRDGAAVWVGWRLEDAIVFPMGEQEEQDDEARLSTDAEAMP
ncbi:MAG: ABC transporter ATP-binding protein [Hyphomicrobiales bacterium]